MWWCPLPTCTAHCTWPSSPTAAAAAARGVEHGRYGYISLLEKKKPLNYVGRARGGVGILGEVR